MYTSHTVIIFIILNKCVTLCLYTIPVFKVTVLNVVHEITERNNRRPLIYAEPLWDVDDEGYVT